MLLMATAFGKNVPKYGARHKRCHLKYAENENRNVGERDQPLLRHLCYAGTFTHCTNWLVKHWPQILD